MTVNCKLYDFFHMEIKERGKGNKILIFSGFMISEKLFPSTNKQQLRNVVKMNKNTICSSYRREITYNKKV